MLYLAAGNNVARVYILHLWAFFSYSPLMWPDGRSPPDKKGYWRLVGQFCPNFWPHSHSKHSGFKTEQHIEILKNAQDAQMMGLNSGQDSSPIPVQLLQGVENEFWPIVPV